MLRFLPRDGVLGFVLPRAFVDGKRFRSVREDLARRFGQIEVIGLPETVFQKSQHDVSLLLCDEPSDQDLRRSRVHFANVDKKAWLAFKRHRTIPEKKVEWKSPIQAAGSLQVIELSEVWTRLATNKTVGQIAESHRGVRWKPLPGVERKGSPYLLLYQEAYTSRRPQGGVCARRLPRRERQGLPVGRLRDGCP